MEFRMGPNLPKALNGGYAMQPPSRIECVLVASLIALVMVASIGTFKATLEAPPVRISQGSQ